MGSFAEHNRLAQHNEKVNRYIQEKGNEYLDWDVTTLYYSALHFVEALLERDYKMHFEKVAERERFLAKKNIDLYKDIRQLAVARRKAQYDPAKYMDFSDKEITKLRDCFVEIKNRATSKRQKKFRS